MRTLLVPLLLMGAPARAADPSSGDTAAPSSPSQRRARIADLNAQLRSATPMGTTQLDLLLELGDLHLSQGETIAAWQTFTAAATFGDAPRYPEALVGLARAERAWGRVEASAWTLQRLVALTTPMPGQAPSAVYTNALDDLGRAFAQLGQGAVAALYFGRIGEPTRAAAAREAKTNTTLPASILANPEAQRALLDPEAVGEEALRGAVGRLLAAGLGAPNPRERAQVRAYAVESARVYLTQHPDAPSAVEVQSQLAELLFTMGRYEEAYAAYQAVMQASTSEAETRRAARGALQSADELLDHELHLGLNTPTAANPYAAAPMTVWANRTVQACDQYAATLSNAPEAVNIHYKAFYILYEHNAFAASEPHLWAALRLAPSGTKANQAVELLLDGYTMTQDAQHLCAFSEAMLARPDLGDATLRSDLQRAQAQACAPEG